MCLEYLQLTSHTSIWPFSLCVVWMQKAAKICFLLFSVDVIKTKAMNFDHLSWETFSDKQHFSNWTQQAAVIFRANIMLQAYEFVSNLHKRVIQTAASLNSQQQHFVVVSSHSADVANPPLFPSETGISFATFSIQERASHSVNPWQIIFLLSTPLHPPFHCLHFVCLWFISEYITYWDVKTSSIWKNLERTLSVWILAPFLKWGIMCQLSRNDFADSSELWRHELFMLRT